MRKSTRRSWLLVPASKAEQITQAANAGADVIVLDLVELVAAGDKPAARDAVKDAITAAGVGGSAIFVQIDPEMLHDDLHACVWPGLDGVLVSRTESPRQIAKIDVLLSRLEGERGIAHGTIRMVAALETAPGNQAAYDIGRASPRLLGLTLGRADLVMDLRPEPSGEIHLMIYLMQRLILISQAVGVTAIGAWWRAPARGLLATPEHTLPAALRGRAIGFKGGICVRANQVEPLNRGYTPAAAEVAAARSLIDDYQAHTTKGSATFMQGDRLIDCNMLTRAQSLLDAAKACAADTAP